MLSTEYGIILLLEYTTILLIVNHMYTQAGNVDVT